ncbi:chemotaxis protein CheB [Pseudolysobacter antarcticus]|uniref:protein-glutamate methylesterase n=1 Tax=Pseudolysobacter antarcticus TaxID=2511995 RepID=A0A411HMM1_9GAMM|nr:chemotaxis protein CheB [Pseudolysobacter antarcticus]QBB71731.1 chemotaxis protein CheB [Pseudolysobacter antarcticus]
MVFESTQVNVGLMYQTSPMPEAMRAALAGLGVSVAYEGAANAFDLAALKASGARAVVVSMDGDEDDAFSTIDHLLADGYALVFNETNVSEALAGYDQARWARHLAAKLHGDSSVLLPMRPLNAEAAATPSLVAVAATNSDMNEAAVTPSEEIHALLDPIQTPATEELPTHSDEQFAAIASVEPDAIALAETHELLDFPTGDFDAAPVLRETNHEIAANIVEDNSWTAFQAVDINADAPTTVAHALTDELETPLSLHDADDFAHTAIDIERQDKASALSFADSDIEFEIADSAGSDNAGESAEPAPLQKSSDWFQGKNEETLAAEGNTSRVADDWALLDFEADIAAIPSPLPVETAAAAPVEIKEAATFDFGSDWALTPLAVEDEISDGPIKNAIPRVWVLFGSIGTPEALREFLAALPEKLAALLVVVAPIGADFQSAMVAQMSKASALPIRVAEHGATAAVGEVLLLPAQGRLQVKPDGRLLLAADERESLSMPEALMRDLIESFGVRAGVILLSGTVNGAIAACQLVADSGGLIWAQQSDSCVISSMVDSADDAGLVQYSAPPRQLAMRLAAICATAE